MGLFDGLKKETEKVVEEAKKDVETLAKEVMSGTWGKTEEEIKANLEAAGYDSYLHVKSKINELIRLAEQAKKEAEERLKEQKLADIDGAAREVIEGKWGNGEERKQRLTEAGYNFTEVQTRVNEILAEAKNNIDAIAREVIEGKWGNGEERKQRLTEAGYNFTEVQTRVNELLS